MCTCAYKVYTSVRLLLHGEFITLHCSFCLRGPRLVSLYSIIIVIIIIIVIKQ